MKHTSRILYIILLTMLFINTFFMTIAHVEKEE